MSKRTTKQCPKLHCLGDFIDIVNELANQATMAAIWAKDSDDPDAESSWVQVVDRADQFVSCLITIRDKGGRAVDR